MDTVFAYISLTHITVCVCSVRDLKEAAQCVEDFKSPKFHSTLVSLWVSDALDRKDVERTLLLSLVLYLWKADPQLLTTDQIIKGYFLHSFRSF